MSRTNHQKLRVGIIGAGDIVKKRHLPGLQKHSEVEIMAVSNSTYESAEKFCQENVPHATPMQLGILQIPWSFTKPLAHVTALQVPWPSHCAVAA